MRFKSRSANASTRLKAEPKKDRLNITVTNDRYFQNGKRISKDNAIKQGYDTAQN